MNLDEVISELSFQAEYEATKDDSVRGTDWTDEYKEGFVDGLKRAIEIVEELKGVYGE